MTGKNPDRLVLETLVFSGENIFEQMITSWFKLISRSSASLTDHPQLHWNCQMRNFFSDTWLVVILVLFGACKHEKQNQNHNEKAIRVVSLHKEKTRYKNLPGIKARYQHLHETLPKIFSYDFKFFFLKQQDIKYVVNKQGLLQIGEASPNHYSYRLDDNYEGLTKKKVLGALSMGVDRASYARFCFIESDGVDKHNVRHYVWGLSDTNTMYTKRGYFDHTTTYYPLPYHKDNFYSFSKSGTEITFGKQPFVRFNVTIPIQDRLTVFLYVLGATSICADSIDIMF